jgi:hypothetical protein
VSQQELPRCPHCGGPTEEPRGNPTIGNMMIMRCRIGIVPTDWCVFCRSCKLHYHLPGRVPTKAERS